MFIIRLLFFLLLSGSLLRGQDHPGQALDDDPLAIQALHGSKLGDSPDFEQCDCSLAEQHQPCPKTPELKSVIRTSCGPTDIAFVIDGSGSISGGDFQLQIEGVASAVGRIPVDDKVGVSVIQFASASAVQVTYRVIDSQTVADQTVNAIRAITQFGGLTGPGTGIDTAARHLDTAGRAAARRVLILSTDGLPNTGLDMGAAVQNAIGLGVKEIDALCIPDPPAYTGADLVNFYQNFILPQPNTPGKPGYAIEVAGFAGFAQAVLSALSLALSGFEMPIVTLPAVPGGKVAYVSNDRQHVEQAPFDTWDTAAYEVSTALTIADPDVVVVRCSETPYQRFSIGIAQAGVTVISESEHEQDPKLGVPVIDARKAGAAISIHNSAQLVTIRGFEIRGGTNPNGGGIDIQNSSAQILANYIHDNTAQKRGGGIHLFGPRKVSIIGNHIASNVGLQGAGIGGDRSGALLIRDNILNDNQTGKDGRGGGLFLSRNLGVTRIERNRITNNSSGYGGGAAIDRAFANVTIHQNLFGGQLGGNIAQWRGTGADLDDGGGGGGLLIFDPSRLVKVSHTIFSMNEAAVYGGGVGVRGSGFTPFLRRVQFERCSFEENRAGFGGGCAVTGRNDAWLVLQAPDADTGLKALKGGAPIRIERSCFRSNHAMNAAAGSTFPNMQSRGGGLYGSAESTRVALVDSSFCGDIADNDGGGVCIFSSADIDAKNNLFEKERAGDSGGGANHGACSEGTWEDNTFVECVAENHGGGMSVTLVGTPLACNFAAGTDGLIELSKNKFMDNVAESGRGGGLFLRNSEVEGEENEFLRNSAHTNGGGIAALSTGTADPAESYLTAGPSILRLEKDQFVENTAGQRGGAIWVRAQSGESGWKSRAAHVDCHFEDLDTFQGNLADALNTGEHRLHGYRSSGIWLSTDVKATKELNTIEFHMEGSVLKDHKGAALAMEGEICGENDGTEFRGNTCGAVLNLRSDESDVDFEEDCVFQANTLADGASKTAHLAIYDQHGLDFSIEISDCEFESGMAGSTARTRYGIYLNSNLFKDLTIDECRFKDHKAPDHAIFAANPKNKVFINARGNYWNHVSGPHDPCASSKDGKCQTNPDADHVSDWVDWSRYLKKKP